MFQKSILSKPYNITESRSETVDRLFDKMLNAYKGIISQEKSRYVSDVAKLDALSPLKVLSRGYSIAEVNGKVIKSVNDISNGDKFKLKLSDGTVNCQAVDEE